MANNAVSPMGLFDDEHDTFHFDIPSPLPALPPERVFSIQCGSELFRLSGASLTSDSPSYFTKFFQDQISQKGPEGITKTLYIDRDPSIFRDIARHLQGYHIRPLDGTHYVRLFADAQFFSLPRLISQLFNSEIFIQIGDRHFQVPKDIFSSRGDTPNFFTLGFGAFFSSSQEAFPGLNRTTLLRPPSIEPPAVPSRSADVFAQLLHLLRGYPLHIQNEEHRLELLRDCRYFHLRGLEQKLIPHQISYNAKQGSSEILIRLEDMKMANVSCPPQPPDFWIHYKRPYVDSFSHLLMIEIGDKDDRQGDEYGTTSLDLMAQRVTFRARHSMMFDFLLQSLQAQKRTADAPYGGWSNNRHGIDVELDPSCLDITLDGRKFILPDSYSNVAIPAPQLLAAEAQLRANSSTHTTPPPAKRYKLNNHPSTLASLQNKGYPIDRIANTSTTEATKDNVNSNAAATHSRPPPLSPSTGPNLNPTQNASIPRHWTVRTGQWRLRVKAACSDHASDHASHSRPQSQPRFLKQGEEDIFRTFVLVPLKLDAFTSEMARNAARGFLS